MAFDAGVGMAYSLSSEIQTEVSRCNCDKSTHSAVLKGCSSPKLVSMSEKAKMEPSA